MDPCEPVTLTAPDGATLTVSAYGGQVLGWAPSPESPRLYLSPLSAGGNGTAIRGGVPVIFPQFSGRGPLPKHGFARDRAWVPVAIDPVDVPGAAIWAAELEPDDATLAIWPHPFRLRITAEATATSLRMTLDVTNTGDQPFAFAAALHTYLTITDPDATISGLGACSREDNGEVGELLPPAGAADWLALEPRDVRILAVQEPVTLHEAGRGDLVLTGSGFTDRVVWNPGPGHGIGDIPGGDEHRFVCVEPAQVEPVELAPGQLWRGSQKLMTELTSS